MAYTTDKSTADLGAGAQGAASKAGYGGSAADGDPAAIRRFLSEPRALGMPWIESPFFESILEQGNLPKRTRELARQLHTDGYAIIEKAFDPELIDEILSHYPRLFSRTQPYDVPAEVQRLLWLDPNRVQDAWYVCDAVKRMAAAPHMLDLLHQLYGRPPIPFQTLNFLPGSQQPTHSDAIHFSSLPSGFMCGVWVALEDVTEDNGPLHYYPGSHRLPELELQQLQVWVADNQEAIGSNYTLFENYVRALIQARGLQQKRLTAKKGTALIWSANLLHGGCAIRRAGSTRRSQVTHYYFEDCLYYQPILSNAVLGEYRLKEVLDLRSGRIVPHTINGTPIETVPLPNGNSRLLRPGTNGGYVLRPSLGRDVLAIVEREVKSVMQASGLDPLVRAQTMAALCDVALRAGELTGATAPAAAGMSRVSGAGPATQTTPPAEPGP
jgi:ectoine hydroxylase-related dioxygenase (phytanoyl-CoA dioxygenase family)